MTIEFFHDVLCAWCYALSPRVQRSCLYSPLRQFQHRANGIAPACFQPGRTFSSTSFRNTCRHPTDLTAAVGRTSVRHRCPTTWRPLTPATHPTLDATQIPLFGEMNLALQGKPLFRAQACCACAAAMFRLRLTTAKPFCKFVPCWGQRQRCAKPRRRLVSVKRKPYNMHTDAVTTVTT
jgi:hypothetical protein